MNYFYYVAFLMIFLLFLSFMNVNVKELFINTLTRCLSGIVFITFANFLLKMLGLNLMVNINQISLVISGILGISGVIFTYIFQWILTSLL